MEAQHPDSAVQRSWPGPDLEKLGDLLTSACNAITSSPRSLMKSVMVTVNLDGTEGEARLLVVLAKELASERNLEVTSKLDGRSFTVVFSRLADGVDGRSLR